MNDTGNMTGGDKGDEMNTITAILAKAVKQGYTENFSVNKKGMVASSGEKVYGPSDVRINNFYRFEGESNPGDMSILYVMETTDGLKGTLIDAYGTYADGDVNAFITSVEDINKKVVKDDPSSPADRDQAA